MEEGNYYFTRLNDKLWEIFSNRSLLQYLEKWYIKQGLHMSFWAFNQPFLPHKGKELASALLRLPFVQQQLPWKLYEIDSSALEPVPCSVTSLEFFDRILDPANGVVRRGSEDEIRGCFEETIEGFTVADEMRQMLLNVESEIYPLYSQVERRELLFRLLQHIVLGGQWCQYEDKVQPYIQVATTLYKDILSVQKNKVSGEVEIRSKCFRLIPLENSNIQDFVYLAIDPGLREVTLICHNF